MRKVLEVLVANQAELQALITTCGDDQVSPAGRLLQPDAAAPTRIFSSPAATFTTASAATSAAAKEDDLADPGAPESACGSDAGGRLPGSPNGCAAPRPCPPRPCAAGPLPVLSGADNPNSVPSWGGAGGGGSGGGGAVGLSWERPHPWLTPGAVRRARRHHAGRDGVHSGPSLARRRVHQGWR